MERFMYVLQKEMHCSSLPWLFLMILLGACTNLDWKQDLFPDADAVADADAGEMDLVELPETDQDMVLDDEEISQACMPACGENQVCVEMQCVCNEGYRDCDGDPSNGCEADLTSASHCLQCGVVCDDATVNPICDPSLGCTWTTCRANFGDCDTDPSNGCEIDLANDVALGDLVTDRNGPLQDCALLHRVARFGHQ